MSRPTPTSGKDELSTATRHSHQPEDLVFNMTPDGNYEQCMVCNAIITNNLIAQSNQQAVQKARDVFYDNQFDINEAWANYHGDMTYREFAEDYLTQWYLAATQPQKDERGA